MQTKTRLFFAIAAVASIPVFAACGGGLDIGAGKYTAIRIASVGDPTLTGSCQANPDKTTTLRAGATAYIYGVKGTSADQLFLDVGGTVLTGAEQSDGSFRFDGKTTNVNQQGQNCTITSTTAITVAFTADGNTVSGSTTIVQSAAVSGNCGTPQGDCTSTAAFVGVQIEDADPPPSSGNNPVP